MANTGPIRTLYESLMRGGDTSRPYGEPEHYDSRSSILQAAHRASAHEDTRAPQDFARGKRLVIEKREAIDLDQAALARKRLTEDEKARRERTSPTDLSAEFAKLNGIVANHRAGNGASHARPTIWQNRAEYAGRGGGMATISDEDCRTALRHSSVAVTSSSLTTSTDILDALMEGRMPVLETWKSFKEVWDNKARDDATAFAEISRIMGQLVDQFGEEQRQSAEQLVAANTHNSQLAARIEELETIVANMQSVLRGAVPEPGHD